MCIAHYAPWKFLGLLESKLWTIEGDLAWIYYFEIQSLNGEIVDFHPLD